MLHLAPVTSDIKHNRKLVESAVQVAANEGADWAITPELCIPGYLFMRDIGVDWILPQPDEWMTGFCQFVKGLGLSVFLSHPELDTSNGNMYNTVFVIDQDGQIIGKHRKIKALRGAEAWSTGGTDISPVECDNVNAGILICADGYKNEVAEDLKDGGAEILVSPVAWGTRHLAGPMENGSNGRWTPACPSWSATAPGLNRKSWTTGRRKAWWPNKASACWKPHPKGRWCCRSIGTWTP